MPSFEPDCTPPNSSFLVREALDDDEATGYLTSFFFTSSSSNEEFPFLLLVVGVIPKPRVFTSGARDLAWDEQVIA